MKLNTTPLDSFKLYYEEYKIDRKHMVKIYRNPRINYRAIRSFIYKTIRVIGMAIVISISWSIKESIKFKKHIKERREIHRYLNDLSDPFFFIRARNTN